MTKVVQEITSQHDCSPLASVALGRALVGNVLLAAGREEGASCQLTINGNGPLRNINTEVNFTSNTGYVKGYVGNPSADLPLQKGGFLDISGGVGIGILNVVRSHPSRPDVLQEGSTMLETSEIGEDLVVYLLSSEQINSAVGLGVQIDEENGTISSAVGFLCTVMPGCTEEELSKVEDNIAKASNLNKLVIEEKKSGDDIMSILTVDLGEEYRNYDDIVSKCSCSEEKFLQSFKVLGDEELKGIIDKNEKNETIRCHWCSREMNFAPNSLRTLLNCEKKE